MIRELEGAETGDLLALCQRFSRSPERVQLYVSVFRRRASAGAQLAASLLCFDLARQGSSAAKHEFAVLSPSLALLARDQKLVDSLLGTDPYLRGLWDECRASLEKPAELEDPGLDVEPGEVLELDLLADVELDTLDFELDVELEPEVEAVLEAEPETLPETAPPPRPPAPPPPPDPLRMEAAAKTDRLLLDYLGIASDAGFEPGRAFELRTGRDTEKLERLASALEPLSARSDAAAGLLFLVRMQLALAQRRTGLFGRTNSRRRELLTDALRGFPARQEALGAAELFVLLGDPGCLRRLEETVSIVANWTAYAARARKAPGEVIEAFLDEAER